MVTRTVTRPLKAFKHSFEDHQPTHWDRYGKVYYLDGAGNLGYGQETVPKALKAAGFKGDIENFSWTSYTGPLGDQMIRTQARWRSESLTKRIIEYRHRYPNTPIYIVGLSAGTGVGVWALEHLPPNVKVDTLVLLGSSLSTNYDMTKCLNHVSNKVYVLHSPHDAILKSFIPVTGTIDGAYLTEPAGLAGLYPPNKATRAQIDLYKEKVINIPWRASFERLGNDGGHTAGTSYAFVRYYIAPKLLGIGIRAVDMQSAVNTPDYPENSMMPAEADSTQTPNSNTDNYSESD
jgi:pimeloyl-ACP methyl ester carboxylesterase